MDTVKKFEDLDIWKESMRLSLSLYSALKDCKDFGLKDQMQRASVSIPSNIAEGFERQTNKEFIQFLYIAKGSCGELRTQLYLASSLCYVTKEESINLMAQASKVSKMIYKLILYRQDYAKK